MSTSPPGSWNWIFSKLTLILTVAVAVALFSKFMAYLLVETISIETFDDIAISVLKTFLNETQMKTVANNIKAANTHNNKRDAQLVTQPVKTISVDTNTSSGEEAECAVCKYVFPPLVR